MRLVTYEIEHREGLGVMSRDGRWIFPLRSLDMDYKTMQQLIENISESEKQLLEYTSSKDPYKIRGAVPMEEARLLAPIPYPQQDVICLGVNYMDHAAESARYRKQEFTGERPFAVYFSKRVNRAVNPGEGILSHSDIVTDLDYEAEMAVIIGKEASHVPEDQVKDYIFGYTIINDVSARTIQNRHKQWYFGKSMDGFAPIGPVVTDEVDPASLDIRTLLNGEVVQQSNTRLLITSVPEIIAFITASMTLEPGDVIATGTPAGVGPMHPGDTVEVEIQGIGTLRSRIV